MVVLRNVNIPGNYRGPSVIEFKNKLAVNKYSEWNL